MMRDILMGLAPYPDEERVGKSEFHQDKNASEYGAAKGGHVKEMSHVTNTVANLNYEKATVNIKGGGEG
jgi:hypothetical protein